MFYIVKFTRECAWCMARRMLSQNQQRTNEQRFICWLFAENGSATQNVLVELPCRWNATIKKKFFIITPKEGCERGCKICEFRHTSQFCNRIRNRLATVLDFGCTRIWVVIVTEILWPQHNYICNQNTTCWKYCCSVVAHTVCVQKIKQIFFSCLYRLQPIQNGFMEEKQISELIFFFKLWKDFRINFFFNWP